jgi:hypothetical protein
MTGDDAKRGALKDEAKYENEHVHKVYEDIAEHFSQTRYKVHPFLPSPFSPDY